MKSGLKQSEEGETSPTASGEMQVLTTTITTNRHHVTSAPFFVALNEQDWVPVEAKARMLEWKIRMDLLEYAARGAPELPVDKLAAYQPRKPEAGGSLAGK